MVGKNPRQDDQYPQGLDQAEENLISLFGTLKEATPPHALPTHLS